jgi:phosphate starvation-inducible PhoH-like protein
MATRKVHLKDSQEALLLFGQHDQNLRALEQNYNVQIFARGHVLSIRGAPARVEKALIAIEDMRENLGKEKRGNGAEPLLHDGQGSAAGAAYTGAMGKSIRPKTPTQKAYVDAVMRSDLVVAVGPAGTGKTYLAVACALASLKSGIVSRIVLTRPVVEAGEKLGFLPGDLYEKVNPYLQPLFDAFYVMLGPDRFRLYRDEQTIEIVPLAYMRGRTLDNAFIILDEGQNATPEQMKMFLTRMGAGSKVIVNGDLTQIDLENKRNSGLLQLPLMLKGIPGIQIVHFTEADVVRHPLVKDILRAYTDWEKREA